MSMKILVADDSATMRRIVVNQLKQSGFSDVSEAEDGADALQKLKRDHFDLLLTDWNMPNMDGLQLIREVRQQEEFKSLPIVVVTTRNAKVDIITALKEGANNYVIKPFGPKTLKEKIAKVVLAVGQEA